MKWFVVFFILFFINYSLENSTIYWDQYKNTKFNVHYAPIVTTEPPVIKHLESGLRRPPSFGKLEVIDYIHDEGDTECMTDTELLTALLQNGYTKHRVPDENGVEVTVEFWILEINSISELTSDFEVGLIISIITPGAMTLSKNGGREGGGIFFLSPPGFK